MIDRLRRGDLPTDEAIFGESALDFILEIGGVRDQGGELAALNVNDGRIGRNRIGRNRIARDDGLPLDEVALRLEEAGFIDERDINAALDVIDRSVRGERVTRAEDTNQELLGIRDTLNDLDRIVNEAGLDLTTMSNEEVLEALRRQGDVATGEALLQEGLTAQAILQQAFAPAPPATQQDFGDLTLIEEVETPLGLRTRESSAQKEFDRLMKRRNTVESIRGCLNAA